MKRKISEELLDKIRRDYYALYDEKPSKASAYLRQVAMRNDIHIQTLHRHLQLRVRNPRTPDPALAEKYSEHDFYARAVWEFIESHTYDDIRPSIAMTYKILKSEDRIPDHISRSHIYNAIERLNLRSISQPLWGRFERTDPMAMWQVDFSKSRFFKHLDDDEIQICPPNFTKRQGDGRSLWFGVAIDDASRVCYVEYFIAKGEDTLSVQSFLVNAFKQKERALLQGLPQSVYVDRGSGWLTRSTENGLAKLGIKQILGADERTSDGKPIRRSNKKARGKVERMVQSLKRNMEQEFFLQYEKGRRMSLGQFNLLVTRWVEEWNQRKHPVRSNERRWEIFSKALQDISYPPEEALAYFSQILTKKVVRRMINVGKGVYCHAPMFVDNCDSVEVIQDNTGHYIFHEGRRYKLQYQQGTTPEQLEKLKVRPKQAETRNIKSELEVDTLLDYKLRERFMEEIGRPLNSLPDHIWQQFSWFFDEPRSLTDIKQMARWVEDQLDPKMPENVIRLPLQALA